LRRGLAFVTCGQLHQVEARCLRQVLAIVATGAVPALVAQAELRIPARTEVPAQLRKHSVDAGAAATAVAVAGSGTAAVVVGGMDVARQLEGFVAQAGD